MKGLGEKIDDAPLVQKILRSFLDRFNPKVSAIEEMNDLKTLFSDQLIGTLTAYEMRIDKYRSTTREASFKADKGSNSDMDEIEAKLLRRLKKGSGKYKGKMPFKCFNCGKIGHFASKCPYKGKDQVSDEEKEHKHKRFNKENYYKKKSLCVNNDDSSSDEADCESTSRADTNAFMLMAIENSDNEDARSELNDKEAKVDMEGELVSALEEIDRVRRKKRKQKQLLIKYAENYSESSEALTLLRVELEEAKKIEDILKYHLTEK